MGGIIRLCNIVGQDAEIRDLSNKKDTLNNQLLDYFIYASASLFDIVHGGRLLKVCRLSSLSLLPTW